ncbi:translation initiation factor IF-3, mitochondrial isoform X2 [Pelodiscus sinensis]|uniref:translation initiation factor IF-3, mitochondrial isoform X2 n=1 Tax=Pelodiscus sinensis TaxID=13735 RepID=UPI003F6C0E19
MHKCAAQQPATRPPRVAQQWESLQSPRSASAPPRPQRNPARAADRPGAAQTPPRPASAAPGSPARQLVPLRENEDPPVYRLMTGKQIHEEQLKLREKEKAHSKTGPVQLKELTFSAAIAKHDLETKIRQIQQWIDKKHHVRISVQQKNVADGPEKMLAFFDQIVETMPAKATYLSQPKVIREGRSTCVLRHMSDKEVNEYKKTEKQKQRDTPNKSENETTESNELQ